MIQRLNDSNGASGCFESGTDLVQKTQSMVNASTLLLNSIRGPFRPLTVSLGFKKLLQRRKGTHDDMVCVGESFEILQILRAEAGNHLGAAERSLDRSRWAAGARRKSRRQ